MQTLTISASVRPGRVAVLCDIADPEWRRSCRHVLEIFSTLWGGHGNIIIPTDGKTIQPIFWQILETFDPDHVCEYRPSLRDLEERDPQAFEQIVAQQVETCQPSVYYQLDEIVYQGFANDMHVPTLALDTLRRSAQGSFLYVEELEYRKRGEAKPLMECDLNCVIDGVLTIGEAKTADRLEKTRAAEAALIEKYRSLAAILGARSVVFATEAESWDGRTAQKILEVLEKDSLAVRLLSKVELFKA